MSATFPAKSATTSSGAGLGRRAGPARPGPQEISFAIIQPIFFSSIFKTVRANGPETRFFMVWWRSWYEKEAVEQWGATIVDPLVFP